MIKKYDLVIVGTSFASSFFLKKTLEKSPKNIRILVLERGMCFSHKSRLTHAVSKPLGSNSFISRLGNSQKTYSTNNHKKPWMFDANFGGSSNCWTGCTPRFMPNDFKVKSLYGIGEDWPISYDDLEPYYCEAEAIMGIAGPSQTPYPMSQPYPLPPHELSSVDKLIQEKFGPLYISQPTARASIPVGKRNGCCSNSICHLCPVDAKFTIANTLSHIYDDSRVELIYNAQVIGLICSNSSASGLEYIKDKKRVTVAADLFALGANAIFNAHILLNSGDSNYYTGKGLCEQIGFYAYIYLRNLENLGGSSTITANGFMLYDGEHRKDHASCLIENHNGPIIRSDFGKWRNIVKLKFIFEDLPQDKNQVLLSDNELKPLVNYFGPSEYARKGYKQLENKIASVFGFLPIEKVILDDLQQPTESHILSTTRMGSSPMNSVIDSDLFHHQYRNIIVLGGGAFPSIAAANPTLTLSAMSLRTADRILNAK